MLLECHNCGHAWDYSGSKDVGQQTNCPDCGYKVGIEPADPAEVFAHRAPQLSADEVATIIREEIVHEDILDDVVAIHIYGSFVDPDTKIDYDEVIEEQTHPADNSDLDVWVEMDGWDTRVLDVRFTGSLHGFVCRLIAQGDIDVYGFDDPGRLEIPISARGDATEAELETIRRAEQAVVTLTEQDQEILGFRPLHFCLGGSAAFESEVGDDPILTVWPDSHSQEGSDR